MRIEELLRTGGLKFDLYILEIGADNVRIRVKTLEFDGDGDSQEFIVKDNILFPVSET